MKREHCIWNKYPYKLKDYAVKARKLGAMEYVLSDIFQKVMVFTGSFLIVRILSKEDYGNYTYLLNIFSIFTLCGDLGVSSAVLQNASCNFADIDKRNAYIKYGEKVLWMVSVLSVLIIFITSFVYPFTISGAKNLFRMLLFLPVFQNEIHYFQSILRIELRNKEYAKVNILATAAHYLSLIGLAYAAGLQGAVAAAYPEAIFVLAIYIFTIKPHKAYPARKELSTQEKIGFWKFALLMQVNQTSLALLNYLDIYCLGITIKDSAAIAEYKVASTIPTALYFIPKSIMFFIVPIMGRKKEDLVWFKSAFKKVVFANLVSCTAIAGVGALIARFIIRFVYGGQYLGSVPCFLVLLAGFVIYGVLQSPASNILSIQEKLGAVLWASITGSLLNIILNIFLINRFGSMGAAGATVISHLFIGCVLTSYLILVLKGHGKKNGNTGKQE